MTFVVFESDHVDVKRNFILYIIIIMDLIEILIGHSLICTVSHGYYVYVNVTIVMCKFK